MMRIAVLCSGYGIVARGVETFLRGLITRLARTNPDWDFDVYTRAKSGLEQPGVRLVHVPAVSRYSRAAKLYSKIGHRLGFYLREPNNAEGLSFALAAMPKLLAQRYDLVFNQAGPFSGWFLMAWRRIGGPPFAHKTASGYSLLELLMKRQKPDLTVATSPFVADWLKSQPPDTPVVCIPNAVDCSIFRPDGGHTYPFAGLERPIVLFVGTIDGMKRPHLAVEAVSGMSSGSLVLIGDGPRRREIVTMGMDRLGNGRFLSLARAPHDLLPAYYNAADVFTLPSEEPFGIVFLEAMACNKPIVSNHSPVQEWMAADAGLTCDCLDPGEYAATLERVAVTDYADRPRRRALEFDWSVIAPKYETAFQSLSESSIRPIRPICPIHK